VGHVSFVVFLNDNDDVFFKHEEEQVPVVAGSLVTFPGDVPHSTIVNSGEVYLLGPFDEHFSPTSAGLYHAAQQHNNHFIRQRKLYDVVDGDGITFESINFTNSTEECSLFGVLVGALRESGLVKPNIIEFDKIPDGVVVYVYQRTVVVDGVVVMGVYIDTYSDGK
jgi:hypothetical protein